MGEVRDAAVTLSNSIIGVAILAMPYCYAQCGFLLATLLLVLSGLATVQSCRMLLQSALATKRRSYEFLAHHVYGPLGKLTVELTLIGLSIGTLVAFFVIIGDLCPQVLASLMRLPTSVVQTPTSRTVVMATIGLCVILPLSLMRDPSFLSKISAISLVFYALFMLHLTCLTLFGVDAGAIDQRPAVTYRLFRLEGLITCLPIFSLAFTCQTQLFLLCDSLRDPSIKVMRRILNLSVSGCCVFYILIGSLGYVAFSRSPQIHGDLLAMYPATPDSDLIKLGFVMSVAISFPIIAFPCRVSIYSFIYLQHQRAAGGGGGAGGPCDLTTGRVYIPDGKFRVITSVIVLGTLVGGLLIPNVEFILSLTGSVTGSVICYILPAGIYLNTFSGDRRNCCSLGCIVKWLGFATLCIGTAATLFGSSGGGQSVDVGSAVLLTPKSSPTPLSTRMTTSGTAIGRVGRDAKFGGNPDSRQEPPLPDLDREDTVVETRRRQRLIKAKQRIAVDSTTVKPTLSTIETTLFKSTKKSTAQFSTTFKTTKTKTATTTTTTAKPALNVTSLTFQNATTTTKIVKNVTKKAEPSGNDLEVLASLLREQREQGRRIEEQLKRLEAAAAAGKGKQSTSSSHGNQTQSTISSHKTSTVAKLSNTTQTSAYHSANSSGEAKSNRTIS